MPLKETVNAMRKLLGNVCMDLEKATRGNKAASQRVRTCTIQLEKVSKLYRKESITAEKKGRKIVRKGVPKRAILKRATAKLPSRRK